jgi:hypothetical protein
VENKTVYVELSLYLSYQLSRGLGGYTVGTTVGFWVATMEALFSTIASPSNLVAAPVVTYEYLFYLPSSERLHPPARWKARELWPGSCTPGTTGRRLQPKNLDTTGPSNGKWLGNHTPRTGYGPTTHGRRRETTNLK